MGQRDDKETLLRTVIERGCDLCGGRYSTTMRVMIRGGDVVAVLCADCGKDAGDGITQLAKHRLH
jgi:uncharacterized Zn finger protein